MDPNQTEQFQSSPKDSDYSKMDETERQAMFRRKRQQYIAEKMARKKLLMRQKRENFGSSSSDSSDDGIPGSRSSKSSQKEIEAKVQELKIDVEVVTKKEVIQVKPPQQNLPKKPSESLQRIPIYVPTKKGNQWVKDVLVIGEKTILIQNITEQVRNVSKVKIISDAILGCPYKIKVNFCDPQVIFAINSTQQRIGLPINYYIFSRLIQQPLLACGIKLREHQLDKIPGMPESLTTNSLVYGRIYKKSQVLGKWDERIVVINKQGIFSYRKFNQKHTMHIPAQSINELWTWLQIQDNLLIIKIWHAGNKTEFGLPLETVVTKNCWLYHFYNMMSHGR